MGFSQTSGSLYGVVITVYEVITTPSIVMLDFNPNKSQIGFGCTSRRTCHIQNGQKII
jgi:hypothetical protein